MPETLTAVLAQARVTANTSETRSKRAQTRRKNAQAAREWNPESLPAWLTLDAYRARIVPKLLKARTVGERARDVLSELYAAQVKRGERTPHPRHWRTLAEAVGMGIS